MEKVRYIVDFEYTSKYTWLGNVKTSWWKGIFNQPSLKSLIKIIEDFKKPKSIAYWRVELTSLNLWPIKKVITTTTIKEEIVKDAEAFYYFNL